MSRVTSSRLVGDDRLIEQPSERQVGERHLRRDPLLGARGRHPCERVTRASRRRLGQQDSEVGKGVANRAHRLGVHVSILPAPRRCARACYTLAVIEYTLRAFISQPRSTPSPASVAPTTIRMAALVIAAAAFAVVMAALPYSLFELDRYTFPKELVLLAGALAATLLCLASARRLSVFVVDALLAGYLAVSAVSALFATNGWLAFRALGVSLAGAALFWCSRAVARAGRGKPVLIALAAAVVVGACTGLAQAYGLVDSSLASLTRAPGGTFGNRNFMAHLVTIGLPVLLYVTIEARSRTRFALGTVGLMIAATALVLSRSCSAWLGRGVSLFYSSRPGGGWAGSGPSSGSGGAVSCWQSSASRAWYWRWSCPTASTGARTRHIWNR